MPGTRGANVASTVRGLSRCLSACRPSERGVRFEDEPHVIARMGDIELWVVFLKDPDGNDLALMCELKV